MTVNKKAEFQTVLTGLIIFAIIVGITFFIFRATSDAFTKQSNAQAIRSWVNLKTATAGTEIAFSDSSSRPPVIDLDKPLEVVEEDLYSKGKDPPKAFKEIGDSMVDCWYAFESGEKDFMNSVEKEKFCFSCRIIKFEDDIKKDKIALKDFNKFLYTNSPGTNNKGERQTYMQILNNDPELKPEPSDLENDVILIDDDFKIIFFAASGRGIVNIVSNLLIQENLIPEEDKTGFTTEKGISKFDPDKTLEPIDDVEGLSASEKAELGAAASGVGVANKYLLPKLAEEISQEAGKETAAQTEKITTKKAIEKVTVEIGKTGAPEKIIFEASEEVTEKAVAQKAIKKAIGKIIAKIGAAIGLKFVSKAAGWPLAVAGASYGLYEVVKGKKPFVAQIMLIDSDK